MSAAEELAEVQAELQDVKKALRSNGAYLGMQGEHLQRYFLQLNEKENLLLSKTVQAAEAPKPGASGGYGGSYPPAANGVHGGFLGGMDDRGPATGGAVVMAATVQAREPPSGPIQNFDKNSLQSVLDHLTAYESNTQESTKALRALTSLAYADASRVGTDERALQQVLRMLRLHGTDVQLQLAAVRALCNTAYDTRVALKQLTDLEVFAALLAAIVRCPDQKELGAKSKETIARIVAAEYGTGEAPTLDGNPPPPVQEPGTLGALFLAFLKHGDITWSTLVSDLVCELVTNEVVGHVELSQKFVNAGRDAKDSARCSTNWLALAKQMAGTTSAVEVPQALLTSGSIQTAMNLMMAHGRDDTCQLMAIEAASSLVGNRMNGLQTFAECNGITQIESALRMHTSHAVLQMKGVRALASGVGWPANIQRKAKYSHSNAVSLTKMAMQYHGEDSELVLAALEALARYLDQLKCESDVKAEGGEGLVKAVMTRHIEVAKVQTWGRIVLDGIGSDRNWQPRAGA
eukprot:gnl/TRDRNA2_/TRDRNA2_59534_c0_seq1.p1 gnl/TRDRNA2_/TRDRNA2_59534_c0~~gnl/TRDRNA2_/TRDRNA2_59534_c0_seq1.p1  ORF type:complete len:564 (-),score=138.10 gnl/TRDRNA2_/TRDRNA2_59534_c0_seq1:130-1686(-)